MWFRGGTIAALTLASSAALIAIPSASASPAPVVTVSPTRVAPGEAIQVRGTWFFPGETVSAQVCGDGGLIGAQGCSLISQATLVVNTTGQFLTTVRAHVPPSPCPCVLEVNATASGTKRVPLKILGAPTAPLQPPAKALRPAVVVSAVHVNVQNVWRTWLGLPTTGTVTYTVKSAGTAPIDLTDVTLNIHSWPSGTETVAAPTAGPLPIGQSQSFTVPVDLSALTAGRITAHGTVQLPLSDTAFSSSAFTLPWVLIFIVLILIGLLIWYLVRRWRARPARERTTDAAPAPEQREPDGTDDEADNEIHDEPEHDGDLDALFVDRAGVEGSSASSEQTGGTAP
jgi:hypothetical protein